ncbi:hypothetical protein [Leptolyngbya sp. NIES-2104]|uniref:hypothetical protein n=1 Tax=Leptolyngbya sp. NIES-2104 TaxID=1552121 RepID=UPI0006ECA086|nr:hypothetical protein [Leptolyngbya sp. NIES-2104]GAP96099.1 hypothetical protein NIES2104_26340 [Leptolyngbya sp. NIES-2104]
MQVFLSAKTTAYLNFLVASGVYHDVEEAVNFILEHDADTTIASFDFPNRIQSCGETEVLQEQTAQKQLHPESSDSLNDLSEAYDWSAYP